MVVTSTDLKTNLGSYLDSLNLGDIIVTRNGRKVARLVKEDDDTLSDMRSLFGILSNSEMSQMGDAEIKEMVQAERGKRV